jgi:hypothetical protein
MLFNIPSPSIGEVFRNHHPFYVPKYQRGYAWESEEITDFINDIKDLRDQVGVVKPHFMGGIVQVHVPVANMVSRKHEVVDGQQRMATVSLAMAAVLEGLNLLGSKSSDTAFINSCSAYAEEITEAFLSYKEMKEGARVDVAKFELSKTDNPYFQAILNRTSMAPVRESHHRLQTAYDTLYAELIKPIVESSLPENGQQDGLVHLYRRISEGCVVINIVSQSKQEAYRLFSVLNDRGRNLTDGDLLRAFTLESLEGSPAIQNQVEGLWDVILDGKPDDIIKFLKAYFPSVTGRRAPTKDMFDTFKQEFWNTTSSNEIRDIVIALHDDKPIFDAIRNAEWPFLNNSIATVWDKDRLKRLVSTLRHEAAHPLLLSAVKLGEKKFIQVVLLLERFVFRYITVVGAHPSPLYPPYYSEAKKMRTQSGTYTINSLKTALRTLITARAPDARFTDNLVTKFEYSDNTSRNREMRYFLSTLESYNRWYTRGGRSVPTPDRMNVYDISAITLEHIYPDNAPDAEQVASMEARKQQLANLTIMSESDNSVIGNAPFSDKKIEFSNSSVGLTKRLATFSDWTTVEMDVRINELKEMALAVFKI